MKRVVYIIGAGLTHAAAKAIDSAAELLNVHVTSEIITRIGSLNLPNLENFRKIFTNNIEIAANGNIDVEQIISLFEESGDPLLQTEAQTLKTLYMKILIDKLSPYQTGFKPDLVAAVFDRHNIPEVDESIEGIITLNYDLFSERALRASTKREIDFFVTDVRPRGDAIPFIKLHGSFDWAQGVPVRARPLNSSTCSPFWVAPSIRKAFDDYPFNILIGRAREILQCDLIRVIGCSLNRNDWHLVRLLFDANWIDSKRSIPMHFIGRPMVLECIQKDYPFLSFISLRNMTEFCMHIYSSLLGQSPPASSTLNDVQIEQVKECLGRSSTNIASEWILSEYSRLRDLGVSTTAANHFTNFSESIGA